MKRIIQIITRFVRNFFSEAIVTVRYRLNLPYVLHMEVIQSPPKPKQTYVFIHGIGNTLHSWDAVFKKMPDDVRIIGIDLLGFGQSPKPSKVVYSARMQARSVIRTLLKMPMAQRPIIVGHSLGAIVAIELARKYPILFKQLILCSPPLYIPDGDKRIGKFSRDTLLKGLYRTLRRYPGQLERLSPLAVRTGFANPSLSITNDTIAAYIGSLESSIINQSSIKDVQTLRLPVYILYGTLDPLVVGANLHALQSRGDTITVRKIIAGHEVVGRYATVLAQTIASL